MRQEEVEDAKTVCNCSTKELEQYPSISIKAALAKHKKDNDYIELELSASDYLGEPSLHGHSV